MKITLKELGIFNDVKWELDTYGSLHHIRSIGDVLQTWCRRTHSDCACSFSSNRISIWIEKKNERYSLSLIELLRTFPKPNSLNWDSKKASLTWVGYDTTHIEFVWKDDKEEFSLWLYDTTSEIQ